MRRPSRPPSMAAGGLLLTIVLAGACSPEPEPGPSPDASAVPASETAMIWPDPDSAVAWRSWGPAAFDDARRRGMPVLLYVSGPGCGGLFAGDEGVAAWNAETRFLPVRIDPERQPHVARRYAPAGCPSISVLDSTGREVVRATDIPADNVTRLLTRVHHHRRQDPSRLRVPPPPAAARRHRLSAKSVHAAVLSDYDERFGGFGGPHKFPEPQVIAFLQAWADLHADPEARRMARHTLDAVLASPLWSSRGVLAYSHTPDWTTPRREMSGAAQAGLLRVLAASDSSSHRQAAGTLFEILRRDWYDADRGVFRTRRLGASDGRWWSDPTVYSGDNLLLIRVLLGTGAALGREAAAREMAAAAGDFLLRECLDADGRVRRDDGPESGAGLLSDQMLASLAFGDLGRHSGRDDFADAARKALGWADRHLWEATAGAYADAPDPAAPGAWPRRYALDDDGRRPAGQALAVEALLAAGETDRARRIVEGLRYPVPPARPQASMATLLLRLEDGAEPR